MENIPIRHLQPVAREPRLSGNFAIRNLEDLLVAGDMVEDLHRHDFFYMLVLKKGSGEHEIDFIPYDVSSNVIFLMRPGQVHRLTLKAGSKGFLVQFKHDIFDSWNIAAKNMLRKVSHLKFCSLEGGNFDKLMLILNNIHREFMEKREGFDEVIKANLSIFLIELVRNRKNSQKDSAAQNDYNQEKLENFFELLDIYMTTSRQVSYFADKLNLSNNQLANITKSLLGKTPSDLISAHILLEAKRQLLATSNQVNQIAYNIGYDDPSYFIRFFKKHTGHSPESFRHLK